MKRALLVLLCLSASVAWAANTQTTASQVTSSTTVGANVDYIITGTTPFGNRGSINIPSASMEHSVIIFQNIKPSVVISSYLSKVQIDGATAVDGTNCQVKMYAQGAIVMPYASDFKPLTCYTGTNYTGTSYNGYTTGSNGGYMKTLTDDELNNGIKSFKLKRGYMVTFATGTAGWGYSRCFIADTEDLEMDLPAVLSGKVSSYRLFKWNDAEKKGVNEVNATSGPALGASWTFGWGISDDLSPDVESVPHKIHKNWPGVADCGSVEYSPHMKTDNEPANSADDEPATVNEVLGYWQDAMRTGMRLCSPSSHDGGYTWLEQFMTAIDARGWRCDILDMHCYWDTGSFSSLQSYYNKYKRPIWISELMYGASWNNNGAFASGRQSQSATLSGAQAILPALNGYAYVERYAWWNSEKDYTNVYNSGLTTVGTYFASLNSGIGYNKSYEFVPVVVIKSPYSLSTSVSGNSVSLTWKDSNGDMMDEIRVQYKLANASSWTTLATVSRKDKTSSGDQSYSYTGTLANAENYCWRVVDMFDGTEYPSPEVMRIPATSQIENLSIIPSNTSDYYFQFYSLEASSDLVWSISSSSSYPDKVTYQTPATIGSDNSQLWTMEQDSYGGYTLRNLETSDYVMCSPNSWDFNTNNDSYKAAAANASYLPVYYSSGDYWVVKNVAHGTYVGLWDNDKNFGVGERLAGNRTNPTGNTDSGDRIGIRAIPRVLVNGFTGPIIASGTYYLYNKESDQFISAGADWGTQAIKSETGIDFTLSFSDDNQGYYLETNISNGGDSHYFGSNRYLDGGAATWIFAEAGTIDGKQAYTLTNDGTNYLAINNSAPALTTVTNGANNALAKWLLLTKSELIAQMENATATNPMNVTFLLPGHGFSRNDGRNSLWEGSPAVGGDATNTNGEKFNTTFDVYQELTVPNGTYVISAQGFYRNGGYADAATKRGNGTEALNATFYVNDVTCSVPSIFDAAGKNGNTGVSTSQGYIPNSQTDASAYMSNGLYAITPLRVEVTDGILRIGIRKTEAVTNDWTLFDNITITYLGGNDNGGDDPDEPEIPEDTRYPDALAAAKAARDANESSVAGAAQAAIDQYEWSDAERAEKSDAEIEAAITVLNNGAAISNASQQATSLIRNAAFTDGTSTMSTQNGGGRVQYPSGWIFIREYSGWNDTFVDNGVFNAWAGTITRADLYQELTGLPNGTYRLTADVRVDNPAATAKTALYAIGNAIVGRSEEAGSDIAGSTEAFASYACTFEVTDNTGTIGIRSDFSFYQLKNIQLEYITNTTQAAQETDASYLRQDYFWGNEFFFDATDAKYANARDVVVYRKQPNQIIKAAATNLFLNNTNVVVNGTCQNLTITDEAPLSITEGFTAANLTYNRTDAADEWQALFVPFAVPQGNGLNVANIKDFSITEGTTVGLTNASFETGDAATENVAATGDGNHITENFDGWTRSGSLGWSASSLFAYGSGAQLNGSAVPSSGPENSNSTQALGISVGWENTVIYSQTVSALPAGNYTLSVMEYNVGNATQLNSRVGVIVGEASTLSSKASFALGAWERDAVNFTLDEPSDVTIQIGAQAIKNTSTNNAKVLFDDIVLTQTDGMTLTLNAREVAQTEANVPSLVKFSSPSISLTNVSVATTAEYNDNDGLHGLYTAGHNFSPLRWYIDYEHPLSDFTLNFALPGDVEEDGILDLLDVVKLAGILANGTSGQYNLQVIDVDGNGHFSLSDITKLVNLIRQQ